MKVTIKEVARRANVSIATVSRAINNIGYMKPQTKQKVFKAIKQTGYKVSSNQAQNKTKKIIRVILPTLNNPFYSEFYEDLVRYFSTHGYNTLLTLENNPNHKIDNYLKEIFKQEIKGIVISSTLKLGKIKGLSKLPIVSFDRGYKGITKIESNNIDGGNKIAEKVLSLGKKNVLIISGSKTDLYPINDRVKSMLYTFNHYKIQVKSTFLDFNSSILAKKIAIAQLIQNTKYDAICCTDDITALLVKQFAESQNYHPLITGFDGTDLIRNIYPDLITIRQPIVDITNLIGEILIEKINNPNKLLKPVYALPVSILE